MLARCAGHVCTLAVNGRETGLKQMGRRPPDPGGWTLLTLDAASETAKWDGLTEGITTMPLGRRDRVAAIGEDRVRFDPRYAEAPNGIHWTEIGGTGVSD
jgi:hypothetical protein